MAFPKQQFSAYIYLRPVEVAFYLFQFNCLRVDIRPEIINDYIVAIFFQQRWRVDQVIIDEIL